MKIIAFYITEYGEKSQETFSKEIKNIIQVIEMRNNTHYESLLVSDKHWNEWVVFLKFNLFDYFINIYHYLKWDYEMYMRQKVLQLLKDNKYIK